MNLLKIFFLINSSIVLMALTSFPGKASPVIVDSVKLNCVYDIKCDDLREKWGSLARKYSNYEELKEKIRLLAYEPGIKDFSYRLLANDSGNELIFTLSLRPLITDVNIEINNDLDLDHLKTLIPLKAKNYFFEEKIQDTKEIIDRYLQERGFFASRINIQLAKEDKGEFQNELEKDTVLNIKIEHGTPIILRNLNVICDDQKITREFLSKVIGFKGRPYDTFLIQELINNFKEELLNKTYYFFKIDMDIQKNKITETQTDVSITFNIKTNEKYLSMFVGNTIFTVQDLKTLIRESMKKGQKSFNINFLKNEIKVRYEKIGLYNTSVDVELRNSKNSKEFSYIFKIKEGRKIKIEDVSFQGNNFFDRKYLLDLFYKKTSVLIKAKNYDATYVEAFVEKIKNEYIKSGNIFVEVEGPFVKFTKDNKKVFISYRIKESVQTTVGDISIVGVPAEFKASILDLLQNKIQGPLNVLEINSDLKSIISFLKDQGYYYARIRNEGGNNLLSYGPHHTKAFFNIEVDIGPQIFLDNIIITGNLKTKSDTILREIHIHKNEVIIPDDLKRIKSALSSLGIFSEVKVYIIPGLIEEGRVNIIVNVKEKDAIFLEFAPGYRTDLGIKASIGLGHNNLMGMNRSFYSKVQANQRMNSKSLNNSRPQTDKKKLEYLANINYSEPYFFDFPILFQQSAMFSQKRYYSYDSQELKLRSSFTKTLTKWLISGIRYQLEAITNTNSIQSETSGQDKNGYLRIGGITPSLSFDFRDNPINPAEGLFLDYSLEYAQPLFYSQKNSDYEINYYKFNNTNNFYLPMLDFGIFAVSYSWGVEENLVVDSTKPKQRIPPNKVFRMNGIDMVRGFRDSEINILQDGRDIDKIDISYRAFYSNFKVEPRFYIDDKFMIGPFYDSGRLFVNSFKPAKLRSAAGLSFKIITPVGPIDFSYGFKLKRKRLSDGTMESPGEFTLSIGSF